MEIQLATFAFKWNEKGERNPIIYLLTLVYFRTTRVIGNYNGKEKRISMWFICKQIQSHSQVVT